MGKLKTFFSNISESIKETFKRFPLTLIIIYVLTFIYVFCTDEFIRNFENSYGLAVFAIWGIGTFFSETWFSKKEVKVIGAIISLVIGIGFKELFEEVLASNVEEWVQKILIVYVCVLPLLTVYKIIKKSEIQVSEYGLKVLSNFGKCTAIYALANIGTLVVLFVFIELLLDGSDWEIISRTLILLLGAYYAPSLINTLTDIKQEPGKFIKIILMYVYSPVASFLIIILYMYIIKIAVTGELLKNSIFYILSLTFTVITPLVILLKNYEENKKIRPFATILLYSFIPLIILQSIAMGIRINDYGLTSSRYMGIVLIIFEIIFIGLIIYKKSKYLDKSLLVVVGLVLICVLSPLNFIDTPIMSQTKRLENILAKESSFEKLTDVDKDECQEIFIYIKRNSDRSYLEKKISKDVLTKIEAHVSTQTDRWEINRYSYIYVNSSLDGLDISEYSKIYEIDYPYNYNEKVDYKQILIKDINRNVDAKVDLNNLVNTLIKADEENIDEDIMFQENNLIKTENENITIYLTNFNFEYGIYTKDVNSLHLGGYILVK